MPAWTVKEFEKGLLYKAGQFQQLLNPGRYSYWFWERKHIDIVDMRETSQTVEGQEILTLDRLGVRVTLIAQFQIADAVVAMHSVDNFVSQLYQDLQLALRESVTSKTLEDLLKDREPLSTEIHASVAGRAAEYGVTLKRVGVKDIVLPGALRSVYLQEVEADLKGRANLVAARHETAAARARANTAKLLQENPNLLRLQELELINSLASKSGNVVVIPGLERLMTKPNASTSADGAEGS